jgi:hypothetical protein
MSVLGSGNVGIGTSSPNCALQFNNTIANRRIVLWDTFNNDHQYYGFGINGNTLRYQVSDTNSGHRFFAGTGTSSSVEIMSVLGSGAVSIPGTLSKGGGSFDIEHPDPIKAEAGYRLRHCFVESPTRGDNIYRFKVQTTNKMATLTLPDYYQHLNENTQVFVTAEWSENAFGHGCGRLNPQNPLQVDIRVTEDGEYNVLIIGTRKDQLMKDFWDEKGAEYIP